ncbi:hypothetical protein [Streptomyces naganishii]|uniref:Uncharacterized protein n=1 Tax=Streptomyces naganishii JCM 4654 TaxID=1306179 RepID=A0A918Y3G9_9ACTN|nr:hypothetical protein [Streptomyces naganishii]GHD89817.1 hypothetical protein GCM10010508_32330 [Streptomyces naganishii JCM 4654]
MSAEHESHGPHEAVDPLTAALTGGPLPPGAGADPAYLAAYRSARSDLALLRRHLDLIAEAVAEPPAPAPVAPERPVRRRVSGRRWARGRRPRALALGAFAAAAAASAVFGLGWVLSQGAGSGLDAGGGAGKEVSSRGAASVFGTPGYLACARLVAEGDVRQVRREPGSDRDRVTLRVTRSYRPAKADAEVTFLVEESAAPGPGDHVLVGIGRHAASPDTLVTGERDIAPLRDRITGALAAARSLTCEQP